MPVVASVSGSPSGAGSALDPYDIKTGVDNLPDGEKLLLRGGDYPNIRGTNDGNDIFRNLPDGLGPDDYTTVEPYEGEPVRLIAYANTGLMILMPANFTRIRFQGLEFVANIGNPGSQNFCSGHGLPNAGSYLEFVNCVIHGFRGVCIQTASITDGKLIGSTIYDLFQSQSGGGRAYCIYVNQSAHRWEVGWNTMYNIQSHAIQHYSTSGEASDCRYHDNLIYNWGTGDPGSGILVANGSGNWVWNNIVHSGTGHCFEAEYAQVGGTDTRNSIWAHNIGYNTPKYGFSFTQNGSNNLLLNNIALGCALGPLRDLEGVTQTTNLFSGSAPAIWENPGTDFRLLVGAAAARGQGTYNANFPLTFDGFARPNPNPDIGPYQYAAATITRRSKESRIYALGWI